MIYQTDTRLKLSTRDDECYLFCLLDIFEDLTKHVLTIEEIEKIHKLLVQVKYITINGFIGVDSIQGIAQVLSGITGKHVYMRLVDKFYTYNYLIGCYVNNVNGKANTHFCRMFIDQPTLIKYDPYSAAGSRTVKEGKLQSYRYIFGEKI